MNIKTYNNIRFTPKGDTEVNWNKAMGFIPLDKEIIIYKPDEKNPTIRIKIGDGVTPVQDLPFLKSGVGNAGENGAEIFNSMENIASGALSHAEGNNTVASGYGAHAQNIDTTASNDATTAVGFKTKASGIHQFVGGRYNIEDTNNKYAFIIGNGDDNGRSNALSVDWDGNIEATSLILSSPNGTKFKISVNDDGTLNTTQV